MVHFHRHATTIAPVNTFVYQPATFSPAGGPSNVVQQAPLVQQPMLTKEVSTTGITNQMASASVAGVAHQTIVKPAIIEETVRTERVVEVQPVIHREIEQPLIHHIEQHITERAAAPSVPATVTLAPIIQEIVHTNVIEEVQPIIHREVVQRQIERVEEHLTERVAAPTIHTAGAPLRAADSTLVRPALVEETVRTDRVVEVQPIVHREISQPRIHHIEQHITEAPAPSTAGVVKMAPIVQEVVHTNVIEEVQPIIHREIAQRQIERVEEHLTERVAAPAIHTHEVQKTTMVNQQGILIHKNKPLPPTPMQLAYHPAPHHHDTKPLPPTPVFAPAGGPVNVARAL